MQLYGVQTDISGKLVGVNYNNQFMISIVLTFLEIYRIL